MYVNSKVFIHGNKNTGRKGVKRQNNFECGNLVSTVEFSVQFHVLPFSLKTTYPFVKPLVIFKERIELAFI